MRKILSLLVVLLTTFTSAWADDSNLLSGKFSVSATKQVQFTKGNLYYSTTDNAYHLESAQNATYGTGTGTYAGTHVYHFFWTNLPDYQSGTASYMPYASTYAYSAQARTDKFFCGVDNPMSVDGTSGLYALTKDEWSYLLGTNTTRNGKYAKGVSVTIGDKTVTNCLVIAPDNYTGIIESSYDASAWTTAEAAGLVCLPAAGKRSGSDLDHGGTFGIYWSATPVEDDVDSAYLLDFIDSDIFPDLSGFRDYGRSVRLVKDAKSTITTEAELITAINNVASGGTVKLDGDIALEAELSIVAGKDLTLDLNGHKLKQTAQASVIGNKGSLTIADNSTAKTGQITGGHPTNGGGGIYNEGTLNITGGTITGNAAGTYGGGIYNIGTLNMTGGTIIDNTAGTYGGGISNRSSGTLNITGGTIKENKAKEGAGVDNYKGTITVGGTAVIEGNTITNSTTKNDLALNGSKLTISTATPLATGAKIGIFASSAGQFTNTATATDAQYFFSDDSKYEVKYNAGGYLETVVATGINNVLSWESQQAGADADADVNKAQGIIKTADYIMKNGKKYNYAGQLMK